MAISFPEVFGWRFRKAVAQAVDRDIKTFIKEDRSTSERTERRWNGYFDQFQASCPVPFLFWSITRADKFRVQTSYDIWKHKEELWASQFHADIWLKTKLLTLNYWFPFEISRCVPRPVDDQELRATAELMKLIDLSEEFSVFYSSSFVGSQDMDIQRQLGWLRHEYAQ
jgi:hypothetical protein